MREKAGCVGGGREKKGGSGDLFLFLFIYFDSFFYYYFKLLGLVSFFLRHTEGRGAEGDC